MFMTIYYIRTFDNNGKIIDVRNKINYFKNDNNIDKINHTSKPEIIRAL